MERMTLADMRKKMGLTQKVLAHLIEAPRSTLSLAELGVRGLSTHSMLLLVKLWKQHQEQEPVEISEEETRLLENSMEEPNRKSTYRLKRIRLGLEISERKLEWYRSKLRDTEKSILLLSRNAVKWEEANVHQKGAEIEKRELILNTLPYYVSKVESMESKIRRLRVELEERQMRAAITIVKRYQHDNAITVDHSPYSLLQNITERLQRIRAEKEARASRGGASV